MDLGEIEPGTDVEAAFAVENRTDKTVRLGNFTVSCGCMGLSRRAGAGTDREPLTGVVLAPGETLDVFAGVRVAGSGRVAYLISFRSDLPGREAVSVVLTAKVNGRVFAIPDSINWGRVRPGQVVEGVMWLADGRSCAGDAPLRVVATHEAIRIEEVADAPPSEVGTPLPEGYRVRRVKLRLTVPDEEEVRGEVRGETDGGKIMARTSLVATVKPVVRATPSRLVLPRRGETDPYSTRVALRAEAPCTFALADLPPGLHAEISEGMLTLRASPDVASSGDPLLVTVRARAEDGTTQTLSIKIVFYTGKTEDDR